MFCQNCGTEIDDDANFCIKCGTNLKIEVKLEEEGIECDKCKNKSLIPIDKNRSTYRCSSCGIYFGNFLNKGVIMYYTTTHVKIARYIGSQLLLGKYMVHILKNQKKSEIDALIDRIRKDIYLEREEIREALEYLIQNKILYIQSEINPNGQCDWFGIDFYKP
ncbi:MAG: zinc ribbon domain-containing protein [Candidatus Thermoplasmatota archaeon]